MRGKTVKHDRRCLANSAIAAVENHRDSEWTSYEEFLTGLDHIREIAQGYLDDEIMTCTCAVNKDREGLDILEIDAAGSKVDVFRTGWVNATTQREHWESKIAHATELVETGWYKTLIGIPGWVAIPDRVERHFLNNQRNVTALDFLTFAHDAL